MICVTPGQQVAPQDVFPEKRPQVPDVHDVVDRGAARVEPHVAVLARREVLDPAAERVENPERHQIPFSF
jgi:hypothetical protein